MSKPLVLRAPEPGGGDDRELGETVRQRGAPTQVLAELCRVLANLRRADQKLEWAPEPATAPGSRRTSIMKSPAPGITVEPLNLPFALV